VDLDLLEEVNKLADNTEYVAKLRATIIFTAKVKPRTNEAR
jgi:hypothetical protein